VQPSTSPTLRTVLERGPLSTKHAVALIVGVARAVDAFAREGLVARELNPDAILVHRHRGAILTDYGMPPGLIGPTTAERDANRAYRSPEEREGRELTARSSVYSLGALLVTALTGAPAPEQLGPRQAERMRDVPPTIESVIAQAMAGDPNRRYADVTEMARAAVEVVRASDRIRRMEAPAPRKQKPSRAVSWRTAQQPATRGLRLAAPLGTSDGAGPAAPPADEREKLAAERRQKAEDAAKRKREEDARRKAAQDAERREKAQRAAQRKAAQDAERREKAEQRKAAQQAERRDKAERAAQRKREQAAAKRERDEAAKRAREAAAKRKLEEAAAKRERDEAAKAQREAAAAKAKRPEAGDKRKAPVKRERPKIAAKRKRAEAARRKAGAAAERNGAPATRRRGPAESGRTRKPRRGVTAKSSAAVTATRALAAKATGSPRGVLGAYRLPLVGAAIAVGVAGVSGLALVGGDGGGEAKATRIGANDLSLRMPAGWERASQPVPRLDWLSGSLGVADSDGSRAALVAGLIREPIVARQALRGMLPAGSRPETVGLGQLEASRYSGLDLGAGLTGTAYVIHTTGPSIAMICRGPEAVVRVCAQAASTVTLRGERPVSPDVAARRARVVRASLRTLSAQRAAARRRVAAALVADDQAKAARDLQASYLHATGEIELSGAYGPRIDALSAALLGASNGYRDLADAISAGDQRAYDAARAAVLEAETKTWGPSAAN
jgi:actin-related protein